MLGAASNISQQINRKAVNRRSAHIPRAGSCRHAFSPRLRMFSCNSSCDLNGDNEDVTISANDGRASSCNMSVSRLMRRRDDTKVCTDPPARVTNNRRDQAIRSPDYGDLISPHLCCCRLRPTASDLAHELQLLPRASVVVHGHDLPEDLCLNWSCCLRMWRQCHCGFGLPCAPSVN